MSMLLAGGFILRQVACTDLSDGIVFSNSFEYQEVVEAGESVQAAPDGPGRKIFFPAIYLCTSVCPSCPFSTMVGPKFLG